MDDTLQQLTKNIQEYEKRNEVGKRVENGGAWGTGLSPWHTQDLIDYREAAKQDYLRRKKIGKTSHDEDVNYRILASSEGNMAEESRIVSRVEKRAEQIADDKRRAAMDRGQSEEDFKQEQLDAQGKHIKYANAGWSQALDELKKGEI